MGKINVLSSKVYNRIAAGEVVERPASVVKELIENSIDAKSTKITVSIENAGLSSIIISDNGMGIEKSDLKKALLPHATSKIATVSDLDAITSLGFRGEALASITSVSKITIKSKPENQEVGALIYSEGGENISISDADITNGTEITVKNLFFNAPVRAKFLKSDKSEESEITNLISKFILGNPNISFKYDLNGKTVLRSYGEGLESAMVCVYGPKILENCFNINHERNGIKVSGYIGKHFFTKANRSFQTVFLNGRCVQNQTISSAIGNAYSAYLMKRQYPFYVLNIDVPPEIVDVNVHPNKSDVRFSNNQIIYGTVYTVISRTLDGTSEALNIIVNDNPSIEIKHDNNKEFTNDIISNYDKHNVNKYSLDNILFSDSGEKQKEENKPLEFDIFAENKAYLESLERKKSLENNNVNQVSQQKIEIKSDLKYIGQALNTYLIFEDGTDIYFLDQHAAHERILFDKLNDALKNDSLFKQPLLVPYIISLSALEKQFIDDKIDVLNDLGFEIDTFGINTIKISTVPAYLSDMDVNLFFREFLSDLNSLKTISANDVLKDKLAQKACKSAIKSGDKLSAKDTEIILEKLNNNLGLKCPHGRPIAIKITRTEIDKWFKRIV